MSNVKCDDLHSEVPDLNKKVYSVVVGARHILSVIHLIDVNQLLLYLKSCAVYIDFIPITDFFSAVCMDTSKVSAELLKACPG